MSFLIAFAVVAVVGWYIWQDFKKTEGTPSERLLGAFRHQATIIYTRLLALAASAGMFLQDALNVLGTEGIKQLLAPYLPEVKILSTVAVLTLVGMILRQVTFQFEKPKDGEG